MPCLNREQNSQHLEARFISAAIWSKFFQNEQYPDSLTSMMHLAGVKHRLLQSVVGNPLLKLVAGDLIKAELNINSEEIK